MSSDWNAKLYQNNHCFVWQNAQDLVDLLSPKPGEYILDLGCGTGQLTAQIAASGAHVMGIDSSPAMIERAHANFPNLHFALADARTFHSLRPFDAVFSNATLHWVKETSQAVQQIVENIRPGGRLVVELGGHGNVGRIVAAMKNAYEDLGLDFQTLPNPWYFPSAEEYRGILEAHELSIQYITLFDRPTPLDSGPEGLRNWLNVFARPFFQGLSLDKKEAAYQMIEKDLRPTLYKEGVWTADYRRLRVVAEKSDKR